jgi:hypothetical protein
MGYMLLLPSGYSTTGTRLFFLFLFLLALLISTFTVSYPLVLYLHQDQNGNGYYEGNDWLQAQIAPWFNNVEFRTNNPCILIAPLLDQVLAHIINKVSYEFY